MLVQDLYVRTTPEGVSSRRAFLRDVTLGAAGLCTLGGMDLVRLQAAELRRRGMACILLFMNGGPSQYETFDPKPGTEAGGPTRSIPTCLPGVHVGEDWPHVAQQLGDLALIRSMTGKEGNHQRAQFLMHTGYAPSATVHYPSVGSLVAHELHDPQFDLPHFVNIGGAGAGSAGGPYGAGFLPTTFAPFVVEDPTKLPTNVDLPEGVNAGRLKRRLELLDRLEEEFAVAGARSRVEGHRNLVASATRLVTSPRLKAFDLSEEKESLRDRYGRTPFGQACLLARRLVETGVPFIEITNSAEGAMVTLGWDTHKDNFNQHRRLAAITDPAFATLIADLKERGLLERTLVIWMGEFGRTPQINANTGRDHYPQAFTVALAGAGIGGGRVVGSTNATGHEVADRPVTIPDLFCTIYHALGIDPRKENLSGGGRPVKLMESGQPVLELFA
jgi:hypothetical protein